jgi:hypothetical protein
MYWIYFAIFVLAIFAPTIFHGRMNLHEAVIIFIIQSLGLLIYLQSEKKAKYNFFKRLKMQKEMGQYSRDLSNTYTYIGEINRKLDILKEIFLAKPTHTKKHLTNSDVFSPILDAAKLFGKSKYCLIRFVDMKSYKTVGEVKSEKKRMPFALDNEYLKENKDIIKTDKYFIFNSQDDINNIACSIIIDKNNGKNDIEDPDIFRILAGRALCLFTCSNCRINLLKA